MQDFLWPDLRGLGTSLLPHSIGQAGPSPSQIQSKGDRSPPPDWEWGGEGRQVHAAEEHITGRWCNSHHWKIQSLTPTNVFFPGEETCANWGGKRTLSQESDRFGPYLQPPYPRASQLSHWQVSRSVPAGFEYLCLF